ncbi:cystatin-F isoform X1 [Bos taurus]|uniref:cystatin-F isoform X1 n=1 Tax=Bos taurus TaxID=9913 RepID=UPI000FC492C9|nr:cystatin-F isoform X1 [Bos taurus]
MHPAGALLAVCGLVLGVLGKSSPDFCSQILKSDAKPGFPKTIKTNDPDVLRAARHSAESFNNCSNDAFLFRESRVSRALVQIVKGLKFMLDMDIGRTTCKKTGHANLDDCSFQTNHTLQWVRGGLASRPSHLPTASTASSSPSALLSL